MQAVKQFLFEASLPQYKANTSNLLAILNAYAHNITTLSLDCFDTILGRYCAQPMDVFYYLQQQPLYRSHGITADIRQKAETRARLLQQVKHQSKEVTLSQIYAQISKDLTNKQIEQLVEAELQAEMQLTYAIQPIVDLILAAKQRGLKIMVVSDTYFDERRLKRLLAHCLPAEANAAIELILCSCQHGFSKSQGLFGHIIYKFGMMPQSILHIGDNVQADFIAPRLQNLHAIHFNRDETYLSAHSRLHAIAAGIIEPEIRISKPLLNPFNKHFTQINKQLDKPETAIGYVSLGPIMLAFANYIGKEVEKSKKKGKQPKVLFLLRDGYLPARACEALTGKEIGKQVRINRFVTYAASFQNEEDIDRYLAEILSSKRFDIILRQLLIPEKVAEPILRVIKHSQDATKEFLQQMRRPDIRTMILNKSRSFRERFINYLKKEIDLKSGDHLLLVDLGYHGTVQRTLTTILAPLNISVSGRYFISLPMPDKHLDNKAMFDNSVYDSNLLHTLVNFIALLEQLCTMQENSIVDYDEEGNPVFDKEELVGNQYLKVAAIQEESLRFINDTKKYLSSNELAFHQALSDYALHELGRMLFYPTQTELDYLQSLRFDINLGAKDTHGMFDIAKGLTGLRRRGMFYAEKNSKAMRMNYPAELRAAGFELVTTLLAQHRLNLDVKLPDLLLRQSIIKATLKRGSEVHATQYEASATHDGYYSLWAPVGKGDIQLSLHLGEEYTWLQVESAELIEMQTFISQTEGDQAKDVYDRLVFLNMAQQGEKLYSCTDNSSTIMLQPMMSNSPEEYIFRLVFRPILVR